MIPKIGQILRRVTPAQDLLNITIAEAIEEATVVFAVVQGGCWRAKLGNGEVFSSHVRAEGSGLSHPIPMPYVALDYLDESCCILADYRKLDSWPPNGWALVE